MELVIILLAGFSSYLLLKGRERIAVVTGLLDRPDEFRRLHAKPTPKVGGLAFILTLALIFADALTKQALPLPGSIYLFLIVVSHFVIGFYDDRFEIDASWRLVLSLAVCSFLFQLEGGLLAKEIRLSTGHVFNLGPTAGHLLTLLSYVCFIYSINLIDGKNGILGIAAVTWAFILYATGIHIPIPYLVAILATLGIFLFYNLRDQVFAGDSGAYVVGSAAGIGALTAYAAGTGPTGHPIYFDQMLVWFLMPTLDAARVLVKRIQIGVTPFEPAMDHFHHRVWHRFGGQIGLGVYTGFLTIPPALTLIAPTHSLWILVAEIVIFFAFLIHAAASRRKDAPRD